MGNTHLTVQGPLSYAKHAVCAKVDIEGAGKGQAEMLPGALKTFLRRMSYLGGEERQPALAQGYPASRMGEQVLCIHTREVHIYLLLKPTSQKMLILEGNGLQHLLAEANTQPDGNSNPTVFSRTLSLPAVWLKVCR